MPNVGDGLGIGLIKVGKDKCPLCEKAPHPARTTSDKKEGKGCLSSIPRNLGCAPIPPDPSLPNYATAAHHLIPANQCLKKFPRLSQMCKTVGYNVNNPANGMSLPTCGQKSRNRYKAADGRSMKYGKLDDADKENVAFLIMEGLLLQWHVGHHDWSMDYGTDGEPHVENYDRLVKSQLRDLEAKFRRKGGQICDPEDGSESGSAVIDKLNALSGQIGQKVLGWDRYFVSAMSSAFKDKYR